MRAPQKVTPTGPIASLLMSLLAVLTTAPGAVQATETKSPTTPHVVLSTQPQPASPDPQLDAWVEAQRKLSWDRLLLNLTPAGTTPGTVVASPSKEAPNYWFHWVRDAGLVLDQVVTRRLRTTGPEAEALDRRLWDFTALSRRQQRTANRSGAADDRGLGEPKFEVTGEPFSGDWGRPQNDSPAVRALTLIRWANFLLDPAHSDEALRARVRKELYDSKLPSDSVIKNDLEYVATHAQDPCIDLWEETWGQHFYTRAVAESALTEGAQLARKLNDPFAADWYEKKAELLRKALAEHWDAQRRVLVITRETSGGQTPEHPRLHALATSSAKEWKPSGLDTAVILGILHRRDVPVAARGELAWSVLDPRVRATFEVLQNTFRALYPINTDSTLAPGIGRYPEDRYDGVETGTQGHAWVLATAGFAEFLYRSAEAELAQASLSPLRLRQKIEPLLAQAERYVARLKKHAAANGNWSEQIHRTTGEQRGARDLSWSHAAFLSMADSRERAWQRVQARR